MRKLALIVGTLAMVASQAAFAEQFPFRDKPFTDVAKSHPNYTAIEYLRENNILRGYVDGTFKAGARINRAEFVKLVMNPFFLSTLKNEFCIQENLPQGSDTLFFSDVSLDAWYGPELCSAKVRAIVDGYLDGTFKPGAYINAAEGFKIMSNIFVGNTVQEPGEQWYRPYLEWLGELKAIPTTVTKADKLLTRGEMAEILYRLKADIRTKPSANVEAMMKW